jgi:hypothetical protein
MVLTQWAFIGPALLCPEGLGLPPAGEEEGLEGLVAIMGEVGRRLGVREDLNLCSGGAGRARAYSRLLLHREVLPCLAAPGALGEAMADHLLQGVAILNPFIQPAAFQAWTLRLLGADGRPGELQGTSRALYSLQVAVFRAFHRPLLGPPLRVAANGLMKLNICLASRYEEWIVRRVESGPLFPGGLHVLEPFLVIPALLLASLLSGLRGRLAGSHPAAIALTAALGLASSLGWYMS